MWWWSAEGCWSVMSVSGEMQNAAKVVRTIEYLTEHGSCRIEDIAELLDVHKTSASRLLATLRTYGWVSANSSRTRYTLGPRLVRIGQAAVPLAQMATALTLAETIRDLSGESVHLSVPDPSSHSMIVLARVDSESPLRVTQPVGSQDPLHSTAVGKVYLASLPQEQLDELLDSLEPFDRYAPRTIVTREELVRDLETVRTRGYALNLGESREDVSAVAVLLHLPELGSAVALSVAGPANRWTVEAIEAAMPAVLEKLAVHRVRFTLA